MSTILNALKRANTERGRIPLSQRGPLLEEEPVAPETAEDQNQDVVLLAERQRRIAIRIVIGMAAAGIVFISILVFLVVWLWNVAHQTPPAGPPSGRGASAMAAPDGKRPLAMPPLGGASGSYTGSKEEDGFPLAPDNVRPTRSRLAPPPTPEAKSPSKPEPAFNPVPTPAKVATPVIVAVTPKPTPIEHVAAPTPAIGRVKPTPASKAPATSAVTEVKDTQPLMPLTEDEQKAFTGLKIGGILWSQDSPIALIDEQYCKVGDMVKGFKVTAIRKGEVHLLAPSGGQRILPY